MADKGGDSNVRLVVLGGSKVGISCLCIQYMKGYFDEHYEATSEESYRKDVTVNEKVYHVEVDDTAGVDRLDGALRADYMKKGDGFIIMYSVISKESFEALDDLLLQLKRVKGRDNIPIVLAGNKCDLEEREVTKEDGEQFLAGCGKSAVFLEMSAKTKHNVQEAFSEIIRLVLEQREGRDSSDGQSKCCVLQ